MTASASTVLFVPPHGIASSITVNGRTYSCAASGTISVPYMDAYVVAANGWAQVAGSGTTAQRPTTPFFGQLYHDNTLGYTIIWEGAAWRQPSTGSAI